MPLCRSAAAYPSSSQTCAVKWPGIPPWRPFWIRPADTSDPGQPEEGLRVLKGVASPPANYREAVEGLRGELQQLLAEMDRQGPTLRLLTSKDDLVFRKRGPAVLEVEAEDDYRVESVQVFLGLDDQEFELFQQMDLANLNSKSHRFKVEVPPEIFGKALEVNVYLRAYDRAGQEGKLGESVAPITLERRG